MVPLYILQSHQRQRFTRISTRPKEDSFNKLADLVMRLYEPPVCCMHGVNVHYGVSYEQALLSGPQARRRRNTPAASL